PTPNVRHPKTVPVFDYRLPRGPCHPRPDGRIARMANARTPAIVTAIAVTALAVVALALGPPQVETPGWMIGDGEAVPQPEVPADVTESAEPVQPVATDEPSIDSDTAAPWPLLVVLAALALL